MNDADAKVKAADLLVVSAGNRRTGIELSEVGAITLASVLQAEKMDLLRKAKDEGLFYDLTRVLGCETYMEPESYLSIKRRGMPDLLVAAGRVENVLRAPVQSILPLPDLVMQAQKPFFVWGFCKDGEALVMLVTFSHF